VDSKFNKHKVETMKPRMLFSLFALFMSTMIRADAFDTNIDTSLPSGCEVKLYYGKEIVLKPAEIQGLYSNAVILLKSSNINSTKHSRQPWTGSEFELHTLQDTYRQMIMSGRYLTVVFKQPLKTETVGGVIVATEIVVSLKSDDRIGLYTIDDDGRLAGHAMFSGPRFLKLIGFAQGVAENTNGNN